MSDITKRIAALSPEKRALLMQQLQKKKQAAAPIVTISKREDQKNYPLSFAQERMWILHQFNRQSPVYNIPAAIQISGPLNIDALRRSLNAVIRRHEVLRAGFQIQKGKPIQRIQSELEIELPGIDLTDLTPANQHRESQFLAYLEGRRPFNLSQAPLLRAKLLRLSQQEFILLLTMHHIVADGWSIGVLIQEIAALYNAYLQNQAPRLPALPIQYADFAHWQRNWLQGDVLEKQLNYWRQQLAGVPPVLELPLDFPRPATLQYRGAHARFTLSAELSTALKNLSRQHGATPFMTLLAAFQTLLYRYTGQPDICVGTPIANRNREEIENLIGFFVNTLVMRAQFDPNLTFTELLEQVRTVTTGAYSHQDLPFEMLVEALRPDRNMSHSPLFQVMFDFQETPRQTLTLADLKLRVLDIETDLAKFDLLFTVIDTNDGFQCAFEYNTDLFKAVSIERMIGHFQQLIESIINIPAARIVDLTFLTAKEQQQLLIDWNKTAIEIREERCLHQIFEAQVEQTPGAPAVVYEEQVLTFQELNEQANQLAHYLRRLGVGPEKCVAICLERSVELVVAIFGVLKAGGAYVPLDPTYPKARLEFLVEDARASVVITQQKLKNSFSSFNSHLCLLDANRERLSQEPVQNPTNKTTLDNLAYIIYTSGSTGKPKGVMVQQRSVLNLLVGLDQTVYNSYLNENKFNKKLKVSLNAPIIFDASVQQLVTLLHGHTLYIFPQKIRSDANLLLDFIKENEIDVLDCVPSLLKILLMSGLHEHSYDYPSIILPGGEAIDENTWALLAQNGHIHYYNMYGPTECTVDSTTSAIQATPNEPTIGSPLANVQIYVLDRSEKPLPVGVPGELHIGGAGLARGYLNRPELTAEKFIPNPFSSQPGERLYKTGDLVRYLPDGNLEFLGRIDHQVKIRGFRIELGEIETALTESPLIKEAVVVPHGEPTDGQQLLAYLMPQDSETVPSATELRKLLQTKLPDYMIPASFIQLEQFPLTPSGKINRRALPAPETIRADFKQTYQAPRTALEQFLTQYWQEVLGISQVGIYDHFFEFGGHSLKAAILMNRLQEDLKTALPVEAIFLAPTVAEFAEYLSQKYPELVAKITGTTQSTLQELENFKAQPEGSTDLGVIEPVPRRGERPLSFQQKRLWFIDQMAPNSPAYNIPLAIRVEGELNVRAIKQGFQEIVRRHEVLRSNIRTVNGRPVLKINPEPHFRFQLIDLSNLPDAVRENAAHQLVTETGQRPFQLDSDSLLRVHIFKLNENSHVIGLTLHHIVSDGWSTEIIIKELIAGYSAQGKGVSIQLPELPIQYVDYAHWQRKWLQGPTLHSQLEYWQKQLAGSPPLLELPTDRPRPAELNFTGASKTFALTPELTRRLKEISQQNEATLFMCLLAAFKVLLFRYSGQTDLNVGTPIANRGRAQIENLIGFFVNTLVIRSRLQPTLSFRELLQQVRETAIQAYNHQSLPFEMLVDALQPERNLSHTPLFQVMFAFQNISTEALNLSGLKISSFPIQSVTTKFDLTLVMYESGEQLHGLLEYNTNLFNADTIQRIIGHFQILVESALRDPDEKIGRLPLLSAFEQQQLLVDWNQTAAPYPDRKCLHQLFEAQVERTPTATALRFQDTELSYRELNQRANQLAHYLRRLGVGPEVLVGICVERSSEMIIGIIGVLKAGGAYVPLDPKYPSGRLHFMLKDARVSVLLTQQHLLATLPENHIRTISLDSEWQIISGEKQTNPVNLSIPENLAYIIYTSGSTGRPKGVMLNHRGVCNLVNTYREHLRIGEGSRILQFFSYSFDGSVADIFMTLLFGATLGLVSRENTLPGPGLIQQLRSQRITTAVLPPAALKVLPADQFPDLMVLASGGESTSKDLVARWAAGRHYFNVYGPTEASVVVTVFLTNKLKQEVVNVPIGRPLNNVKIYILDSQLNPVPIGIPGELYIGGICLARGYSNRQEITAEKFIPNPFNTDPGARLYKTGDRARYLPDGNIEFLGRIDHQVKVRGFRIEPGEIEAILAEHPQIKEAVVLAHSDEHGNNRLIAYLVPTNEHAPNSNELRGFLKNNLPEYMLPSVFMKLEALPLTPNGKLDRAALPEPEQSREDLTTAYVAPRNAVETQLAQIWCEILGLSEISVYDNFFELGGDSILSIQVIAKANQDGLYLTPRQLFQAPTIAGLAELVGQAQAIQAEQGLVSGEVPLTPVQHWFYELNLTAPHHWNQAIMFKIGEPLAPGLLSRAVQQLQQHHDILRLRVDLSATGVKQYIPEQDSLLPFLNVDLSRLPEWRQKATIETLAAQIQASLDLVNGPLMRVAYFDLGQETPGRLLVVIHHLIIDGVSWRILVADLFTAYQQLMLGESIRLPLKTTSFPAWAKQLTEYAQSAALVAEAEYWLELTQQPIKSLPLDFPASPDASLEAYAEQVMLSLNQSETDILVHRLPAIYGTEINAVLLTALSQALFEWTGEKTLLVNLEGHGREDLFETVDLSRTVGWFTTQFPVKIDLADADSLETALQTVQAELKRIPGRGIGFGLLRYLSQNQPIRAKMEQVAQPEITFNYLGQIDQALPDSIPLTLAPESVGPSQGPRNQRTSLISINGSIVGQQLQLAWSFSRKQFRRETIQQLADNFALALKDLIELAESSEQVESCELPETTLSEFPEAELSQTELTAVLSELNED